LELYLQELARNPANAEARSGIAALRERLLARAQNALLDERLMKRPPPSRRRGTQARTWDVS